MKKGRRRSTKPKKLDPSRAVESLERRRLNKSGASWEKIPYLLFMIRMGFAHSTSHSTTNTPLPTIHHKLHTIQHKKLGITNLPRHFNLFAGVFIRQKYKTDSVVAIGHKRERLSPSRIAPG
jgi:hypothetical protein